MKKFFKKPNGELNFINISIVVGISLLFFTLIFVFLFIGEGEIQTNNSSDLNIDTGIPAQHQNVRLEKDKQITYVTQNEVEKIVSRVITKKINKIQMDIDKNQKENLDIINEFQKKIEKKINKDLTYIKKENSEQNKEIDFSILEKKINTQLEKENSKLKERIKKLEDEIDDLENNITDSSNNNLNDRKIELPSNNYKSEPVEKPANEKEPEVKTKIVYRDRIVEKEPEPVTTYIPFTLEGIFAGQNNVAVINDNGRTSNVKEGSNYKQFKFKKINDSSVIVAVDGREITVNLKDGGREF